MKTKTWAVLLALALGLSVFTQNRNAEAEQRVAQNKHEAVVLQIQQVGRNFTNNGSQYCYQAFKITCSSSSSGAPKFPQECIPPGPEELADAAQAIADLLDQGFQQVGSGFNGNNLLFVKTQH